ncbi:hypothetical protein [Caenispirillum bisanense]|uniref:MarR family transcriptional regulator n=1 Tax=Caenispirillum bisanense TaxID=414052 RepID=A0A286GX37_9PROT|nr:hypothetical protein [Caenispirillum bisanense]SOE00052.1 hypothetical protein SAMN05421508_11157 [Caenispirillum bisanense]
MSGILSALTTSHASQVFTVARLAAQAFERRVGRLGLTGEQAMILSAVLDHASLRADALPAPAGCLPADARDAAIGQLAAEGLVSVSANGHLSATAEAEPLRPALTAALDRIDTVATNGLDPMARQAALYLLTRLADNLARDVVGGTPAPAARPCPA